MEPLPVIRTQIIVTDLYQRVTGKWVSTVAIDAIRTFQSIDCETKANALALACVHILTPNNK